jgi:hypothetical protein
MAQASSTVVMRTTSVLTGIAGCINAASESVGILEFSLDRGVHELTGGQEKLGGKKPSELWTQSISIVAN